MTGLCTCLCCCCCCCCCWRLCRQVVAVVSYHDWLAGCSPACSHTLSDKSHAWSSGVIHGLSACSISSPWFSPQRMWCHLD